MPRRFHPAKILQLTGDPRLCNTVLIGKVGIRTEVAVFCYAVRNVRYES